MKIKTGDTVMVIAGKDKGKTGKVLFIDHANNKLVVEGANIVTKHKKPQGPGMTGDRYTMEAPIDASNVMYYDEKNKKATRLGYRFEDGKKVRFMKSSDETIN